MILFVYVSLNTFFITSFFENFWKSACGFQWHEELMPVSWIKLPATAVFEVDEAVDIDVEFVDRLAAVTG